MRNVRGVVVGLVCAMAAAGCNTTSSSPAPEFSNYLEIKRGAAPTLDGKIAENEWTDGGTATIMVQPDWPVKVHYKHDGANVHFAFANVKKGAEERFPEVLVDLKRDGSMGETKWFHASYRDCQADGKVNDWASCKPEQEGWAANNYPVADGGVIEMTLSFTRLGITPGKEFGLAIHLTDSKVEGAFWPVKAKLQEPSAWGRGIVK